MFKFFTDKKWFLWAWIGSLIIISSLWFQVSIDVKIKGKTKTFIAGGRYNDLSSKNLGLRKIPAVGAAVNLGVYE